MFFGNAIVLAGALAYIGQVALGNPIKEAPSLSELAIALNLTNLKVVKSVPGEGLHSLESLGLTSEGLLAEALLELGNATASPPARPRPRETSC